MLTDFIITATLIMTITSYGNRITYMILIAFGVLFYLGWRWLRHAGVDVQRKVWRWMQERFIYFLPLFPLFSFVTEAMAAIMPVGAFIHYYLSIGSFLTQVLIIQVQTSK